jgi:hypothetical protein
METAMKKPRAVKRGNILTREVPDLGDGVEYSNCSMCAFDRCDDDTVPQSCVYPALNSPERKCMDRNTIYIEATDEAWAQYIALNIALKLTR